MNKKIVKVRLTFWLIIMLFVGLSVISCKKQEFESDLPILFEGNMKINTTYQLKGILEFDAKLTKEDDYTISVNYGDHVSIFYCVINDSTCHVVVDGTFVRFVSSDYDNENNIERYDRIVSVFNMR